MNARTCLAAAWIVLISMAPHRAGSSPARRRTVDAKPEAKKEDDAEKLRQFLDTVTVSATLNPESLKDTPSTVSVIDAQTIDRRLIQNTADLIKFEPGVYIDSNLTRAGLNGFNIRGIGGNRVMTMIDGVETAEQFDFGPFNMHQVPFDLDVLKSAEIVRSAGSSLYGSDALGGVVTLLHEGSVRLPREPRAAHRRQDALRRARIRHERQHRGRGRPRPRAGVAVRQLLPRAMN